MKILDLLLVNTIILSFFVSWNQEIFSLSPQKTDAVSIHAVTSPKKGHTKRRSFLTLEDCSPERTWAALQNELDTMNKLDIENVLTKDRQLQVADQQGWITKKEQVDKKREHIIVLRDNMQDELFKKAKRAYQHKLRAQREFTKKYEIIEKKRASKNLLRGTRENWPIKELEKLIEKGADVSFRDSLKRTALHWAALEARPEIVELLLTHGSDPNVTDFFGNTPLHLVVEYYVPRLRERRIVIEMLLKERVNIYIRNHNFQNVFDIAYNPQFQNFVRYSYLRNM